MRTNWNLVFPERFLPSPGRGFGQKSHRSLCAGGLWERRAISTIIKNDLAYDAYSLSVEKDITRRQCQDCNIHFTIMAAVQRHRQGKGCTSYDCVYIPTEVLDDVEEFDSDDCLMHGDELVINILDILKTICFKK